MTASPPEDLEWSLSAGLGSLSPHLGQRTRHIEDLTVRDQAKAVLLRLEPFRECADYNAAVEPGVSKPRTTSRGSLAESVNLFSSQQMLTQTLCLHSALAHQQDMKDVSSCFGFESEDPKSHRGPDPSAEDSSQTQAESKAQWPVGYLHHHR